MLKAIFKIKMYVCLCEAVSDHDIREAVDNGATSVGEVMCCTRAGTRCGSCRADVADTVAAARAGCRRLDMLDAFALCAPRAA